MFETVWWWIKKAARRVEGDGPGVIMVVLHLVQGLHLILGPKVSLWTFVATTPGPWRRPKVDITRGRWVRRVSRLSRRLPVLWCEEWLVDPGLLTVIFPLLQSQEEASEKTADEEVDLFASDEDTAEKPADKPSKPSTPAPAPQQVIPAEEQEAVSDLWSCSFLASCWERGLDQHG